MHIQALTTNVSSSPLSAAVPHRSVTLSPSPSSPLSSPAAGRQVRKGDEVGAFHLGSTVVLVFEAPRSLQPAVAEGATVRFGQPLATLF